MSITVRLPALLQTDQAVTLTIDEPVRSIPERRSRHSAFQGLSGLRGHAASSRAAQI